MTDAVWFGWWVVRWAEEDCELPIVVPVLSEKGRIERGALEHLPEAPAPGMAKSATATAVAAPERSQMSASPRPGYEA